MHPDAVAASHPERTAALLAALGPDRLAALLVHFRDDLARLVAVAGVGADDRVLHDWAHRLQGSGSTLGLDATAMALASVADIIAAHPDGAPRRDLVAALATAEAGLARAWHMLAASLPDLAKTLAADPHGASSHDPDASNR